MVWHGCGPFADVLFGEDMLCRVGPDSGEKIAIYRLEPDEEPNGWLTRDIRYMWVHDERQELETRFILDVGLFEGHRAAFDASRHRVLVARGRDLKREMLIENLTREANEFRHPRLCFRIEEGDSLVLAVLRHSLKVPAHGLGERAADGA